jgi:superoxide dismutase
MIEVISISKKAIDEMQSIINDLKNSQSNINELEKTIKDRGLEKHIDKFEKTYSGQINDFIKELKQKGDMSKEEKAKLVMEMKKKLTPEQQKQFNTILSALKGYLKKK